MRSLLLPLGRLCVVICFGAVTALALFSVKLATDLPEADKYNHVLAFSVLSFGLFLCWRLKLWLGLSVLLGYGILLEIAQTCVPGRQVSVMDIVADCAGILIGTILASLASELIR